MAKDYFYKNQVQVQELISLLTDHFGQSQSTPALQSKYRTYKYQKKHSPHYVELTCSERGHISDTTFSPDFPIEERELLRRKIHDTLVKDHGTKITQIIGFCSEKVLGYFRYQDKFQILPMPADAPKSDVWVSHKPFILEVAYKSSSNVGINHRRIKEKAVIYSRLLNLLSNQIISIGTRYMQQAWTVNTQDAWHPTSEWKELAYIYPGKKENIAAFTPTTNLPPIERVSFSDYYGFFNRKPNLYQLPDNLEQSLDKAFSLTEKRWRMFFMACSWYSQYEYTWQDSNSSAYIALVTALECLIKDKEKCTCCGQMYTETDAICHCCNQPMYHITQNFKTFLNKYFPMIDQFPEEKRTIYGVRSQLAHGLELLQADLEPWNFMIDTKEQNQITLQTRLYRIVGVAIYNWLHQF